MEKIISGKVREVYDLGDGRMVIVTTDRISAFDVILPTEIPGKGKVLNALSNFWFGYTKDIVKNHLISSNPADMPEEFRAPEFEGRTILVRKLKMLPYEIIVRGYMFGSMWEAYQKDGSFSGCTFGRTYRLAEKLDAPILTPSTKAQEGHDVNVSKEYMADDIGAELARKVEDAAVSLFETCAEHALKNGIIIADTKFEFGLDADGGLVLADEVLTPDSSRFWSLADYEAGTSPKSYDKQFVRDWLKANGLAGRQDVGPLPADIVVKTAEIYRECQRRICGE
ncbi:MAG: phosphoribosylaminoimidazolesuccinocarboxamide synthase [Treponemataceae bacterium]|nr:phosphoribosylaminoimidazolesuccinocarboxamide synthase [Treponemataceae bacterium]